MSSPAKRAKIDLYSGKKLAGSIILKDSSTPAEPDMYTGGTIYMQLPYAMCGAILELLRHEKPVFINFDDNEKRGILLTNNALVGR